MAEKKYVRARSGFLTADRTIVKAGQIVASDDAIVKGRGELFEPMEDHVEAATRAPGERRLTVHRPDAVVMSAAGAKRGRRRSDAGKAEEEARRAAEKEAAEKAAAERAAAEQAEPERLAAEVAEAERLAAEKAAGGSNKPPQGGGTPNTNN